MANFTFYPIYTPKSLTNLFAQQTIVNIEELREYALSLPKAEEDKKFIDVKCDPETIGDMRSRYEGAFLAWHINKEHWLGVKLESDVPSAMIKRLIKDGYSLIVDKLPKRTRDSIGL